MDLPGIASLTAISHDEEVTVEYLRGCPKANTVLCVVLDATKLSVEFGLLKELAQLDLPAVLALTKNDLARDLGAPVDIVKLAQEFGVPVVEVDGLRGKGFDQLKESLSRSFLEPCRISTDFDPVDCATRIQPATSVAVSSTRTERIDRILLHRVLGLPILLLILFAVFQNKSVRRFFFWEEEFMKKFFFLFQWSVVFQHTRRNMDFVIRKARINKSSHGSLVAGLSGIRAGALLLAPAPAPVREMYRLGSFCRFERSPSCCNEWLFYLCKIL